MAAPTIRPTGHERTFDRDDIIVSKTDLKGRITYANDTFLQVSGYVEEEILGQPHNAIRHPDMPACVFQLLWETIQAGREIFAYVLNLSSNGDHYWVLAHVTPTRDAQGTIIGYHSNRRVPEASALAKVIPLYEKLRREEQRHERRKDGQESAMRMLVAELETGGVTYDELVWSL